MTTIYFTYLKHINAYVNWQSDRTDRTVDKIVSSGHLAIASAGRQQGARCGRGAVTGGADVWTRDKV